MTNVNAAGLTYYEWLRAAGARGRCSDRFHMQWAEAVDPAEIRIEFERELQAIREQLLPMEPTNV